MRGLEFDLGVNTAFNHRRSILSCFDVFIYIER